MVFFNISSFNSCSLAFIRRALRLSKRISSGDLLDEFDGAGGSDDDDDGGGDDVTFVVIVVLSGGDDDDPLTATAL